MNSNKINSITTTNNDKMISSDSDYVPSDTSSTKSDHESDLEIETDFDLHANENNNETEMKNKRNKNRKYLLKVQKSRKKYQITMIKDTLESLPYNHLQRLTRTMSNQYLKFSNKIVQRENSLAEFNLDRGDYDATSTCVGFQLTASARVKERSK